MVPLNVLSLQVTQVLNQVEALRQAASEHAAAGRLSPHSTAVGFCDGVQLLLGQVRAEFDIAARKAAAQPAPVAPRTMLEEVAGRA